MAETLTITLAALVTSLVLFGAFMVGFAHVSLTDLYYYMYLGAFGSSTSWQDTLTRAAPLILTALCTALPARLGLIIIGGEGALVLGGLAATAAALAMPSAPAFVILPCMMLAGMLVGGLLIAGVGVLRDRRGVNETISSLLVAYIAIDVFSYLVEGPMRDPASLNKPSTLSDSRRRGVGQYVRHRVHWGLAFGIVFCILGFILMRYTTFGFAVRMVGGNVRAAQGAGLPVGKLIFITCLLGGARGWLGRSGRNFRGPNAGECRVDGRAATDLRAFLCRSSPGTIRWRSFRRRFYSAG